MKNSNPKLSELITLAQRQRGLRDELLERQQSLAREVTAADLRGYNRSTGLARMVVTLLLLVAPSTLVVACVNPPDGRDMRTEVDRTHLLEDTNDIIAHL